MSRARLRKLVEMRLTKCTSSTIFVMRCCEIGDIPKIRPRLAIKDHQMISGDRNGSGTGEVGKAGGGRDVIFQSSLIDRKWRKCQGELAMLEMGAQGLSGKIEY